MVHSLSRRRQVCARKRPEMRMAGAILELGGGNEWCLSPPYDAVRSGAAGGAVVSSGRSKGFAMNPDFLSRRMKGVWGRD